jgi:5-methylcytosine-specific restriction endonuclease McrA
MLYDVEEKERRGYTDAKTRVRFDGSEVLKGRDWKKRKAELAIRSGGRCEWMVAKEVRCRSQAIDPHHIVPRSKGRDDRISNLLFICRLHHILLDHRKVGG